jgi:hypothetical protein
MGVQNPDQQAAQPEQNGGNQLDAQQLNRQREEAGVGGEAGGQQIADNLRGKDRGDDGDQDEGQREQSRQGCGQIPGGGFFVLDEQSGEGRNKGGTECPGGHQGKKRLADAVGGEEGVQFGGGERAGNQDAAQKAHDLAEENRKSHRTGGAEETGGGGLGHGGDYTRPGHNLRCSDVAALILACPGPSVKKACILPCDRSAALFGCAKVIRALEQACYNLGIFQEKP